MPAPSSRYDAVIIGGGHNGLACACYLAAGGLKVAVFERRGIVGGTAVTEEFHPGFRNSTASYTVSLLNPKVIRDLNLAAHGLSIVERPLANFLPLANGDYLKVGGGLAATQAEVGRFSAKDAAALPAYYAMLDRVAGVLRSLLLETPPNVGGGPGDWLRAWKVGGRLKRLTLSVRRDLLDLFTKSAGEVLDRWFESEPIKAAFGFDAIVGNFASPYTPGSAYVLLHHVFGEVNGKRGTWGHAMGGMGSITQAMAKEARARGVEIFAGQPVDRVIVGDGRATGIVLADGREIAARRVVANVNPKLLYLQMIDAAALDGDFRRRIEAYRCASATFRMNVALDRLPAFTPIWRARTSTPGYTAGRANRSWRCSFPPWSIPRSRRRVSTSRACSASTPTRNSPMAARGTTSRRRSPCSCSIPSIGTLRTSEPASSPGRRFRRWISSGNSGWSAATSSMARSPSTSCFPRGRCSGTATIAVRSRVCTCAARERIPGAA